MSDELQNYNEWYENGRCANLTIHAGTLSLPSARSGTKFEAKPLIKCRRPHSTCLWNMLNSRNCSVITRTKFDDCDDKRLKFCNSMREKMEEKGVESMSEETVLQEMIDKVKRCEEEIGKGIIGQRAIIRQVLLAILSDGNVLLEGVPGLGKTELVKAISKVLSTSFSRIQFTPDLMPADVTGTNLIIKEEGNNVFQFEPGPVFANIVLADEINRATPKTQSALLEAMQEKTVTVGKTTYELPKPFMVLATQNPIENEGTYPLPEAQLDRFLFKLLVEFPSKDELKEIMDITITNQKVELSPIMNGEDIMAIRTTIKDMPISDAVMDYALSLVVATHPENANAPEITKNYVANGASPRAAQAIVKTAKARAFMEGRYNVAFEDVQFVAYPALRHRLALNFEAISDGVNADDVVREIMASVKTV